jgi:hypothetical protein
MFACSEAVAGALKCPDKLIPKMGNLILCKKQQPFLMSNFHISQMWKKIFFKKGVEWSGVESGERTFIKKNSL